MNPEQRFFTATPDRCYRVIDFPFIVKHSINYYDQDRTKFNEIFFYENIVDPKFINFLDNLDLKIKIGRLYIYLPNHASSCHIDITNFEDQATSLNFAFNDIGTIFNWYNLKKNFVPNISSSVTKTPYLKFEKEMCDTILTTEIQHKHGQPFLINTGYIHSYVVGDTNRFTYSYFLRKKSNNNFLQWDDAVEIFKNYIVS